MNHLYYRACRRCQTPFPVFRSTHSASALCSDACRGQTGRANVRKVKTRETDESIHPDDAQRVRDELTLYACQEQGARTRGYRGNAWTDFRLAYMAGFPLNRASADANGLIAGGTPRCGKRKNTRTTMSGNQWSKTAEARFEKLLEPYEIRGD